MEYQSTVNRDRKKLITGLVILLVFAALLIGLLTRSDGNSGADTTAKPVTDNRDTNPSGTDDGPLSLIEYAIPDGWSEGTCEAQPGVTYLFPQESPLNCSANPSAPIKLSIDAQNTTDCQQLQNVQDVKKHTCISLFIDGYKSLKASTEYLKTSDTSEDTTISRYFINTNKGVVKLEYTHGNDAMYQTLFDQFATSIAVK